MRNKNSSNSGLSCKHVWSCGEKVQKDKVMMRGWKWKNDQLVEVTMIITTNKEKIRMINVKNSSETLGVWIIPSLRSIDEHEYVERKMIF